MNPTSSNSEKAPVQGKNYWHLFIAMVKDVRWSQALIAFCLAVTLWYAVTVRDKVETWVDVGVQFKGAPADLVISEGLINKLAVRVRVARGLSRSLTGREAAMVVDLSSITRGSNAIAITRDMLPFTTAYEVVEVSPSRILVVADTMATRVIDLESRFDGKLAPDLFVKSLTITPQKVEVSGADSLVSGVTRIRIPIPLTQDMPKGTTSLTVAVPMTANVTVNPPQVGIGIEVGVRTKQLKLTRPVTASGYKDGHAPAMTPDKVTIVANIPESLAKDQETLAAITASVELPPNITEEPRTLPVSVKLPDNAELVSVTPSEVTVMIPAGGGFRTIKPMQGGGMRAIHDLIVALQGTSELNRLTRLDNGVIFEEPLIGVADGHDPLFSRYKTIIGEFHLTPGEVLGYRAAQGGPPCVPGDISVVCWALPFAAHIKKSNARKEVWSSVKWGHAYDTGEAFNNLVRRSVELFFTERGILAAALVRLPEWRRIEDLPGGHTSNWSERHALFAAGLGTFSINDGFITEKGMAMRCGSVVVNTALPVTERRHEDHRANCLFVAKGLCGKCMERCPAFAVTAAGHDKVQCRRYRDRLFGDFLHDTCGLDVRADFCGLCQTGTPCESANPMKRFQEG